MKIRFFLNITLLLICTSAIAQIDSHLHDWYPGIVILDSDEIAKGDLSYDPASDLIMCRTGDKIKTFGPQQAVSFQYYDPETNVLHKFEVFDVQYNSAYSRKSFFEIVLDGDINYIRKRNRYPIYQPRDGYLAERNITHHELAFDYFVELDGQLIKSRKFKKEVLPQLLLNEQSLESYMNEKRLKVYNIRDQILLLSYYNRKASTPKSIANIFSMRKGKNRGSD